MDIVPLLPGAIWFIASIIVAWNIYSLHSKQRAPGQPFPPRITWLISGVVALGGAGAVTSILYVVTSDDGSGDLWGGVPLMLVSAAFFFRAWRGGKASAPALTTFREKSAAITIIAILLVYGGGTWAFFNQSPGLLTSFGIVIGTSVLMAIIMTISHVVLAMIRKPEAVDERDTVVGWRSSRNGYVVMSFGLWAVMMAVFAGAPAWLIAYGLLEVFVLAELTRLASELIYYRLNV